MEPPVALQARVTNDLAGLIQKYLEENGVLVSESTLYSMILTISPYVALAIIKFRENEIWTPKILM